MLPTLPEELLSHIFSFLALPRANELADAAEGREGHSINEEFHEDDMLISQQTLSNTCLASKSFYPLAWPTLYSAYSSLSIGRTSVFSRYFLRTLCLKPEYGKTLRLFSICGRDTIEEITIERLYDEILGGDAMTMVTFQWRARNFWLEGYEGGQRFRARLVRSLLIGMDDGIMCMILLMCPNITELDISLPWDCHNSYLLAELFAVSTSPRTEPPPMDRPVYEPPSSRYVTSQFLGASWPDMRWQQPGLLEFLSEFTLRSDVDTGWETILVHVILLPSLKTLRIYNLIEGPSPDERTAVTAKAMGQAKSRKLQTLHLPECQLAETGFRELIQLFPHLRTLTVEWSDMHRSFISIMDIGRAIARFTPQLLHLTLDASLCRLDEDSFDDDRRMSDTVCDSIKDMQYLERLKFNDQAIWSPLHIQNGVDLGIQQSNFKLGIRHILPTRVKWLEVISPRSGPDLGWDDLKLYAQYQSWQDRDLRALLLDESITELERLDVHNCKRELYPISVCERGWMREAVCTGRGVRVERLSRLKTRNGSRV